MDEDTPTGQAVDLRAVRKALYYRELLPPVGKLIEVPSEEHENWEAMCVCFWAYLHCCRN